ncbi:formimidoylglutamase [Sungkyunkwania multivorans]|uniref:Formimidoylglutamase n=1 Tax=Sungkyunkwania multivorans TaxID=1173618 RepID=A0ABW3CY18_9FLAO
MPYLKVYNKAQVDAVVKKRKGETKFGERVLTLESHQNLHEQLIRSDAKYVLVGIKEDIGVKANLGRIGAANAWEPTLAALLNTQHNKYNKGSALLLLGCLDFSELQKEAKDLSPSIPESLERLYESVAVIDKEVTQLSFEIISAKKTPVFVGGGHNNAYGIIKGAALAHNKRINVINFDAHTDLRATSGRHSGNGFSYAMAEGFLKNYFVFGIHENYTSKKLFEKLEASAHQIQYNTFEELEVDGVKSFDHQLHKALDFIKKSPFGIELDVDAIENIPSSARTPSGFSSTQARKYVRFFGKQKNAAYLHICEAAPDVNSPEEQHLIGKLLSYLITDFI